MVMASSLARFAVATARSSTNSSNKSKSVNNALSRFHPSLITRIRAHPHVFASLVRTLATAAAPKTTTRATPKKRATKTTTRTPTTKKTTRKTASKAKAKPKKKSTKKKKPAKKPVKKKVLTEKQKLAQAKKKTLDQKKKLQAEALAIPKGKVTSPYTIYFTQQYSKISGATIAEKAKAVAAQYKNLSPHEREELNIIAVENKAENERNYDAWLKKHTPEQIRLANKARSTLRRTVSKDKGKSVARKGQYKKIPDSRQVKGSMAPFLHYYTERSGAGVFKNIKASEAVKLASDEFKSLSPSESKKYQDLADADKRRYAREYQSTYGHPPPTKEKKVAAAS